MMACATCGGVGLSNSVCPECGKNNDIAKPLTRQDVSALVPQLERSAIPKSYIGVNWSPDMFWVSHSGIKGNRLVETFVNQMDKIHNIFASGKIPQRSAIMMAPSHYGKLTWVYSCIQHALKAGYTCAPVLDTSEIRRLFVLSSENPTQKVGKVDYDTYIESDVCFFTVVKNEYRRNSYSTVLDLLDKRNRRGLDTFGVSRFSLSEISSWDRTGEFRKISVPYPDDNLTKIPALISCL